MLQIHYSRFSFMLQPTFGGKQSNLNLFYNFFFGVSDNKTTKNKRKYLLNQQHISFQMQVQSQCDLLFFSKPGKLGRNYFQKKNKMIMMFQVKFTSNCTLIRYDCSRSHTLGTQHIESILPSKLIYFIKKAPGICVI